MPLAHLECCICTDNATNSQFSTTSCGHLFHTTCILTWFNQRANAPCPLCNADLLSGPSSLTSLHLDVRAEGSVHESPGRPPPYDGDAATRIYDLEGDLSEEIQMRLSAETQLRELEIQLDPLQRDREEESRQSRWRLDELEAERTAIEIEAEGLRHRLVERLNELEVTTREIRRSQLENRQLSEALRISNERSRRQTEIDESARQTQAQNHQSEKGLLIRQLHLLRAECQRLASTEPDTIRSSELERIRSDFLEAQLIELRFKLDRTETHHRESSREVEELRRKLWSADIRISEKVVKVESLRERLAESVNVKDRLNLEVNLAKDQVKTLNSGLDRLKLRSKQELEHTKSHHRSMIQKLEHEKSELTRQLLSAVSLVDKAIVESRCGRSRGSGLVEDSRRVKSLERARSKLLKF